MQIKTPVHVGLVVILAGACALQAESRLSILSAAGGVAAVAPGSFAVGYGPIGAVAVIGQADDHGALPTDLGGYSVLVNGTKAQIQYVGPSQVNFIVPEDSNLGDSAVVIRSANQDVLTGSATIRPLAPAIFTMVQNGREFGAILNAVTFSGGPFDALTSEIQGCDQRTRLAIFATGMGFSMNRVRPRDVRVEAQDANGTVWPLDVEAAVAAPGLPAVEQINVAIPAGLNTGTMVLR
ncbi:MAG: hypothetical protein JWP63_6732, partial [Candidatus Solibacter sp.]|nr:hypothetical protein [Candidatus Solibacter sp.]